MKRMIVRIPASFALSLLTTGRIDNQATRVEIPGLPADARHIGAWHHHPSDSFDIVVEHDSFQETPPGCEHRRLEVNFVQVDGENCARVLADLVLKGMDDRGLRSGDGTMESPMRPDWNTMTEIVLGALETIKNAP